jgi:hypothetical protein
MGAKPPPIFIALNSWNDARLDASDGGLPSVMVRRSRSGVVDSAREGLRLSRRKREPRVTQATEPHGDLTGIPRGEA